MRTTVRALAMTLGLSALLALPCSAAEPAVSCPGVIQAPMVEAGAPAPESFAEIFGTVPAPQQKSSTVTCEECPGGPNGPYRQCWQHCRSYGWCIDQCYADASTCELWNCICLPC